MTTWTDWPFVVALVVDFGEQEIDSFGDLGALELVVRHREHQPFEHVARRLNLAFVIGFIAATLVPAGAKATVWILQLPSISNIVSHELGGPCVLTINRLALKLTLPD